MSPYLVLYIHIVYSNNIIHNLLLCNTYIIVINNLLYKLKFFVTGKVYGIFLLLNMPTVVKKELISVNNIFLFKI